jgi:hypothetical protein
MVYGVFLKALDPGSHSLDEESLYLWGNIGVTIFLPLAYFVGMAERRVEYKAPPNAPIDASITGLVASYTCCLGIPKGDTLVCAGELSR